MRSSLILLVCSLLGVAGGASLIGRWAVGCAVIFGSLCAAAYAVWGRDDGKPFPQVHGLGDDGMPADVAAFIDRVRQRRAS